MKPYRLWLGLLTHSLYKRFCGITSAIECVQAGFTIEEGQKHTNYQLSIHMEEMNRIRHQKVQEYIKNHERPKPLPLP